MKTLKAKIIVIPAQKQLLLDFVDLLLKHAV